MNAISSENNPLVKHFTQLRKSVKYRSEHQSLIISGQKIIQELSKKFSIKTLISTEKKPSITAEKFLYVTFPILKKITGLSSPDGFAAEFSVPMNQITKYERILVCDNLQDPGNLGTLFRTALAFDFDGVLLLPGCVDPFNDKALRASKGAVFFLPFQHISLDELKILKNDLKINLLLADIKGHSVKECSFKTPFAIILGNEGHGASYNLKKISSLISIPMENNVESLNVSICGSLLMYLSHITCQTK